MTDCCRRRSDIFPQTLPLQRGRLGHHSKAMKTALAVCTAVVVLSVIDALCSTNTIVIPDARVPPSLRKFNSTVVEDVIANMTSRMASSALAMLFRNTFPNTLDTTVVVAGANDSFVITGDIDAMWLRDSTNQVLPYIPFASQDVLLREFLQGLVLRQLRSVVLDSYANAFNYDANGNGHQDDLRKPQMTPSVFEGKYEVDSLCSVLKLMFEVANRTGAGVGFLTDPTDTLHTFLGAVDKILTTFEAQQESTAMQNGNYPYEFFRVATDDTYPRLPVNYTGMVRSAFRPSDDRTTYDFLIPSNAYLIVSLQQLDSVIESVQSSVSGLAPFVQQELSDFNDRVASLIDEVTLGMSSFATTSSGVTAYETDGFGHFNLMDDANIPSLLSFPMLGYSSPTYPSIRKWVLSSSNPWFFSGSEGEGVGSPHTGPEMIWPMSIITRALTSDNDSEISSCLEMLLRSANNTGFMHESFNKNNVSDFTRPWFAWANTLFGSLITTLAVERPHLIFRQ